MKAWRQGRWLMVVSEAMESGGWGRMRSSARRRAWAVGELRMRRVWRRAVVMKSKPVRLVGGLVGWGGDAQLD